MHTYWSAGTAGILALIIAAPALAGTVTVEGGFVAYSGPTWAHVYPLTTVTTPLQRSGDVPRAVPLLQPLPGDPDGVYGSAGIGLGALDLTYGGLLPPAAAIEFWQSFDGSKDGVNGLAFTPGPAVEVARGDEFLLGSFTLTNGGWFGTLPLAAGGSYAYPESAFGFVLTTRSLDPMLDGQTFSGTLRLRVTATTSPDAEFDADYVYFLERPDLGYVGAYESYNTPTGQNTGTIDLYGYIGSLIPTRFDNPQGVVLAESVPVAPVPLPGALGLLLGALATLAGTRRGCAAPRSGARGNRPA